MTTESTIKVHKNDTDLLSVICAGLVKEGVVFHCELKGDEWVIAFTGGY